LNKSPDAFRTISEVAEDLDLPQHVLRFWETRFNQIKPLKRGGGRRYYRPDDVLLLRGIRHLLYEEGYTIRGLQRILKEQGIRYVIAVGAGQNPSMDDYPPQHGEPDDRSASAGDDDFADDFPDDAEDPADETIDAETEIEDEMPLPAGIRPGSSRAVPMSQAAGAAQERAKGLFGMFRGREAAEGDEVLPGAEINAEDRRSLQATLYELLECKRLLDQVRGD
jgi:DNA-binding transcriptional MerR regulator